MNQFGDVQSVSTFGSRHRAGRDIVKNNRENNTGSSSFYRGQTVNGLVVGVGDSITVRIGNQEVFASKDLNPQAMVGDTMLFDVLQISDQQVVLGLAGSKLSETRTLVTLMRTDTDRDSLLSRKERSEKQLERENEYRKNKQNINQIQSTMTEKDYIALGQEGFAVEDFTISGLESALNRTKSEAKGRNNGTLIDEAIGIRGQGAFTTMEVEQKLVEANLPVTDESVRKIMAALSIYGSVGELTEGTIEGLINKNLAPSLANIYKAQYSSHTLEKDSQMNDQVLEELLPQIREVIQNAGYEANQMNLNRANWLLEREIPLTEENLQYYISLKEGSLPEVAELLDKILQSMKEGLAPEDTLLVDYDKIELGKLVNEIQELGSREIRKALVEDRNITLKELISQSKNEDKMEDEVSQELTKDMQMEELKALRHLEEIRLRMTVEAASRLERKGFHIETKRLENVVEELRRLEENYYKQLLSEADLIGDENQIHVLKVTTESMEQLKATPSYVLGSTLQIRKQMTLPLLLEEGSRIAGTLSKANEAYESLLTQPSAEYGDSIQKAFHNSVSMLEEMGLEDSIYNRRALRILGYNQMEITAETMEQVKAYDLQVNTLMRNLHPAVTVRMIKEGMNPLELPLDELNERINNLREEQGINSDEKYSNYLWKLEKEEGLLEDERKAYIGIYRLLHNIDKSDGAALGAVIKADQEVTLSHLLTAVSSIQKGAIDAGVDDSFGTLESITYNKVRIAEQLGSVFQRNMNGEEGSSNQGSNTPYQEARQEAVASMVNQMISQLTPSNLNALHGSVLDSDQATSQFLHQGIWDNLKDISVEKFFDQFITNAEFDMEDASMYESKLQQMRDIYQNSDAALRFLDDFRVPSTTTNLQMTQQILSYDTSLIKKLQLLQNENIDEKSMEHLQKMESLVDTLIDKKTINETLEQMEDEVNAIFDKEIQSHRIDSTRLAELKSIGTQISLLSSLGKKEFYQIPIETKKGFMNMNLTVVRGTKKTGKVTVSLQSENLGRVKVDISLKDKEINGYIACDSRRGIEQLQDSRKEFDHMLEEEKLVTKQLEVCFSSMGNESYTHQQIEDEERERSNNPETERQLYRIAKHMVRMIAKAEKADHIEQ